MAKATHINDSDTVTAHLKGMDGPLRSLVEAIRKLVLESDNLIGEHIKWNSPAFFFKGPMADFDPKTYQRDLLVIHLRKGFPLLVFPRGAFMEDITGLLVGDYSDGRRMLPLKSMEDLSDKASRLQELIRHWAAQQRK
ncbi:MAG: DUF1801 domain-containing protein [Sediminicola sp.]|tara:strand:- start:21456 stop:21869 length:414 start_codon:yes stop_codon:yes gene_type:complete